MGPLAPSALVTGPRLRIALVALVVLALLLAFDHSSSPLDRLSSSRPSSSAFDRTTCAPTALPDRTEEEDLYSLPGLLVTRPLPSNSSQSYPLWQPLRHLSSDSPLPSTHGQLLPLLLQHLSTLSSSPSPLPQPLHAIQNKTILLLGDSNERALVDSFCSHIAGKEAVVRRFEDASLGGAKWHADPHVCEVELGVDAEGEGAWMRMVGVMMFGVLVQGEEEGEELWGVRKDELEGPWTFAARVELARRFVEQLDEGRETTSPRLLFSSTLWDLMYAADYSYFSSLPFSPLASLPSHTPNPFAPPSSEPTWGWTPSQLSAYLASLSSAIKLLHKTFPTSPPLTLRTLHPLAHIAPPGRDFWNPLRTAQLNSAIRAASLPFSLSSSSDLRNPSSSRPRSDGVKLFDLHRLLEGMPEKELLRNEGKDRVHLEWKTAGWVWMEAVLEGVVRAGQ